MSDQETKKIAALNDLCRQGKGGEIYFTRGIASLPMKERLEILETVRTFNDFNSGNNPYGERDFGAFIQNNQKIFWKIDYYNLDKTMGSEDPADPKKTTRVLTIMLASEY